MSNKTEVLSFDDALNNHKNALAESLVNFDEGHRVRKIMLDIDSNSADYEYYFKSGQQSKQAEIDELQNKYDAMYRAFTVADDCRKEWHRCYVGIRQREDELQKRINKVVHILTYTNHASTPLCNELREILKGEDTK